MNKRIYNNYYGIVILPPENIKRNIIKLAGKIKNIANAEFVVSETEYLPHITLYHIAVSNRNYYTFKKQTFAILKAFKDIQININTVVQGSKNDIYLNIIKNKKLQDLQKALVDELYKYFDQDFDLIKYYKKQKFNIPDNDNFKKFGISKYAKTYNPHITLSVLEKQNNISRIVEYLKFEKFSFTVNNFAICRLGDFWQCQDVVDEIVL